ncbi:MAG TPA: DUF748 domain-containing protein [Thermoanaerobaculia bacterium]|nr:DUF748 domain-containing protein [Thermoanaerobaculia bacterium]
MNHDSVVVEETSATDRSVERPRRRGLLRLAAAAAVVLAVYALTGFLVVPRLARWAIEEKGRAALHREVTLGEIRFNPFTFDLNLSGLRILDRDRQPLFSLDRLHLQLALSGIFKRAWRLGELRIDRPHVELRILRDGKLSIADLLTADNDSATLPRLIIDQLAIRDGKLDFTDQSVTPPAAVRLTPVNAEVRDLVTLPEQRGEHTLSIAFAGEKTKSTIRMIGRQTLSPFGLSGRIEAHNIALASLAERFSSGAPILLRRGQADVGIDYALQRRKGGGLQLETTRGELTATGIALGPRGQSSEQLVIPRLEVREARIAFPARRVEIGSVRIIEPRGSLGWDPQGRLNWSQSATPQNQQSSPVLSSASAPWSVKLDKTTIERGALHIEDQQTATPTRIDLDGMSIEANGISNSASAPIALSAAANANGSGRISLRGTLVPSPFALDLQSSLAAIELTPFRPYIDSVRGLTLAGGNLGFDGRMRFSPQQPFLIEGNGVLSGLEFLDANNQRLLGCRTATLRQVRLDGSSSRFRIGAVDADGMYANVAIDKQKNLNLSAIGSSDTNEPKKGSFDIGLINIRDGTIDYRDDSLALPFATAIRSANGKISDFSTTSTAASTIRLDGDVADHGSMKAEGTMHAVDPFADTDLSMRFKSIPMPKLTPYFAEFAGYEIDHGTLDLDLQYRIVDRKLAGDHRVVATDLTLGKKTGGSKAGFAVRLAVALLKDRNGLIALQVPIEGNVDSPEFNYRAVFWQAMKTILGGVAQSPFRALGRSMGVDGENLDLVAFDPGVVTFIPPEAEKLRKIAGELAARPELTLQIEGRFDPELDGEEMRKAKLELLIEAHRDPLKTGASEPPSLETILETLYSETFSPERLAQERAKFTTAPAPPPPEPPKSKRERRAAPPPPTAVAAAASFNGAAFYDEVRKQLVAAQTISPDDFRALGRARAAAIASALTAGGTLQTTRLETLDPTEAKSKPGSQEVRSEMKLSTREVGSSGSSDD